LTSDGPARGVAPLRPGPPPRDLTRRGHRLTGGSRIASRRSATLTGGSRHLTGRSSYSTGQSAHLTGGSDPLTGWSSHLTCGSGRLTGWSCDVAGGSCRLACRSGALQEEGAWRFLDGVGSRGPSVAAARMPPRSWPEDDAWRASPSAFCRVLAELRSAVDTKGTRCRQRVAAGAAVT